MITDWKTAFARPKREEKVREVVADLISQHGLTRDRLDTLTAPARVVPRLAEIVDRALPSDGEQA